MRRRNAICWVTEAPRFRNVSTLYRSRAAWESKETDGKSGITRRTRNNDRADGETLRAAGMRLVTAKGALLETHRENKLVDHNARCDHAHFTVVAFNLLDLLLSEISAVPEQVKTATPYRPRYGMMSMPLQNE